MRRRPRSNGASPKETKHSVNLNQTRLLVERRQRMLFSNGLKSPPTPNAHSAAGKGFHFQGATLSIPTHRRKEVRELHLCLLSHHDSSLCRVH